MTIDREAGTLTLDAEVVLTEGWLECLACVPGSKEHESIITIATPPSVVHLGLLTLGAVPGEPLKVILESNDEYRFIPPSGQQVTIEFLYEKDGQLVVEPANRWIRLEGTDDVLEGNTWVFAGSKMRAFEDEAVYMADLEGVTISLVSFGSDLLAHDNTLTDQNDVHNMAFVANTAVIPPVGTQIRVRLTVVPEPPAAASAPAAAPGTQPAR